MHTTVVNACKSSLKRRILEALTIDGYYFKVKEKIKQGDSWQRYKDFRLKEDGIIIHRKKVHVLDSCEIRKLIQQEM